MWNEAEFYAVNYELGNSVSGSYGSLESSTSRRTLDTENLISEIAAVSGISTNFSSGDDGDYSAFGIPATVNAPADSPWATAVGGVSLALNSDNSIAWQAGWGNNECLLARVWRNCRSAGAAGFLLWRGRRAKQLRDAGWHRRLSRGLPETCIPERSAWEISASS